MKSPTPKLDPVFIEQQRRRLMQLREELLHATQTEHSEEAELQSQSLGEAREFEEEAQKLAMLEVEGALAARNAQRLALIDRALQKIEEGTYGLSDRRGEPIPRERLEAVPEATQTAAELEGRFT